MMMKICVDGRGWLWLEKRTLQEMFLLEFVSSLCRIPLHKILLNKTTLFCRWTFLPYLRVKCTNVPTVLEKSSPKTKTVVPGIVSVLKDNLEKNEPADIITWRMLGGKDFMPSKPSSPIDFVLASVKGIPKLSVINLATVLDVPMKDMATLLNVSYKTLGRKKKTDILNSISSSLTIEIANTIAKGLAVFEDADKFNRWLHKENRALKGQKPFDLLNTPTGIKLVNQIIGRIEEGVYS